MINCVAGRVEQVYSRFRRFGKKVFDVQELDAKAYHRKIGNNDIFTILDKDHNKLLVQKVRLNSSQEQESVTKFFLPTGREITIKSTLKNN